jgi:hypothetical protein
MLGPRAPSATSGQLITYNGSERYAVVEWYFRDGFIDHRQSVLPQGLGGNSVPLIRERQDRRCLISLPHDGTQQPIAGEFVSTLLVEDPSAPDTKKGQHCIFASLREI